MGRRLELNAILKSLLPEGKKYVYFQPPENVKMQYPCIVYKRDGVNAKAANNQTYSRTKRYQVTIIDSDPDSEIPDKVAALPKTSFSRFYVANQLNHDIYSIYF